MIKRFRSAPVSAKIAKVENHPGGLVPSAISVDEQQKMEVFWFGAYRLMREQILTNNSTIFAYPLYF